jgi:anti-anti-sigma regulatory factor
VCRNANGAFVLTGLSDAIRKLITISQLEQILTITPSLNEAVDMIFSDDVEKPSS